MRVTVACALVLSGCYASHSLSRDAGRGPRDANIGVTPERDAGELLPERTDPDLGPDARPSEYPESEEWRDPVTGPVECCELDEPILIADDEESYGEPVVEWGDRRWGLFLPRRGETPSFDAGFVALAPEGRPLGPIVSVGQQGRRFVVVWAEGRFGATLVGETSSGSAEPFVRFARFDALGRRDGPWIDVGVADAEAVARLTHGDRWLVPFADISGIRVASIRGGELEAIEAISTTIPTRMFAVGLRSRATLVTRDRIEGRAAFFGWPPAEVHDIALAPSSELEWTTTIGALRDLVIVVESGAAGISTTTIDPFAGVVVTGPNVIDRQPADRVDFAPNDKDAIAGFCFVPDNGRSGDTVFFRILDQHGRAISERIEIARADGPIRSCSVGQNDGEYLVAWNDARTGIWVRRVQLSE